MLRAVVSDRDLEVQDMSWIFYREEQGVMLEQVVSYLYRKTVISSQRCAQVTKVRGNQSNKEAVSR